jgi:hypothetical protein
MSVIVLKFLPNEKGAYFKAWQSGGCLDGDESSLLGCNRDFARHTYRTVIYDLAIR